MDGRRHGADFAPPRTIVNPIRERPLAPTASDVLYPRAMELSMPLEEAMRTQRAIRRLKPDPVDDALVLHLIELALKAPTGSNAQNWEVRVHTERTLVPQGFHA